MIFFCCDRDRRRNEIDGSPINGIDFLEVEDNPLDPPQQRQRKLFVHFINPLLPGQLSIDNVRIDGGERIRPIVIVRVTSGADASIPDTDPRVLVVEVEEPGDFSIYTLRLLFDRTDTSPVAPPPFGFDPYLSSVDFEFKAGCRSDFDCKTTSECPPAPRKAPVLDYLAKDYASFRQMMLDRIAVLAPQWRERSPADLGVMLVELLAYVGDYLSYRQDAIATEAYLGTARRRVSVRRHARLVDYPMHDGLNARTWVQIAVSQATSLDPGSGATRMRFLTMPAGSARGVVTHASRAYADALTNGARVFEIVDGSMPGNGFHPEHNEIRFHTWGNRECCLPKGATQADLRGELPNLQPGHVLVFVEALGPSTGMPEDADPSHRHAVRIRNVWRTVDPIGGAFDDPKTSDPVAVTRIEWDIEDALPFPLCISSLAGQTNVSDVSVALGNIALADHGRTIENEPVGIVPVAIGALTLRSASARCEHAPPVVKPPRFRPVLAGSPVTFAVNYDASLSATAVLAPEVRSAAPSRVAAVDSDGNPWTAKPDLLGSGDSERDFVVEIESDGRAFLRFGDGTTGARPREETEMFVTYRIGNGAEGNIGADSLGILVSSDPNAALWVDAIRNPLSARGGLDPESIESVLQYAPEAFRVQERAVTTSDYAEKAQLCDRDVQRATATFRWTGSWRTVFVTVDRKGGRDVDDPFETKLRACLEKYRMAGHDLEVERPRFVSLDLAMLVCVDRGYFASDVYGALLDVFSNRVLTNGTTGLFHPDRFTFGQPVYLSALYAAAQSVPGVESVEITKLQRQGVDSNEALLSGRLDVGRLEIVRLDNDPNFRERGVFAIEMRGGR